MNQMRANGIEIAYQQQGFGPDLVLIAGVGYSHWFWHQVLDGLAEHFRVTVFDNRGTGASEKPAGPYTIEMMAADTAGLMDGLGINRAFVLGHSLGGYVAQRLVASRPELVSHLILASTNFGGSKVIPITPQALQLLTNRTGDPLTLIQRGIAIATHPHFGESRPELVQALIAYRLTNPVPLAQYTAQVMAGAATAAWSEAQIAANMAAITMPTLILFGEGDQVVPPGNAQLLGAKIPQAQTVIFANTGHLFPLEDPAGTITTLCRFQQSNR